MWYRWCTRGSTGGQGTPVLYTTRVVHPGYTVLLTAPGVMTEHVCDEQEEQPCQRLPLLSLGSLVSRNYSAQSGHPSSGFLRGSESGVKVKNGRRLDSAGYNPPIITLVAE